MAPNPVRSKGRKRCPPAVTCERFAHRSTRSTNHKDAIQVPSSSRHRAGYPDILWSMTKILVSLDDKLLARIDKAARALGLNRSAYLSRVAAREVDASRGPGRTAAIQARHALRRIDKLFAANQHEGDVTRAVRQERDSHLTNSFSMRRSFSSGLPERKRPASRRPERCGAGTKRGSCLSSFPP